MTVVVRNPTPDVRELIPEQDVPSDPHGPIQQLKTTLCLTFRPPSKLKTTERRYEGLLKYTLY